MNREEERSPPSPRCECWEDVTVSDTEEDRCGTTCPALYHSDASPVRSATPFDESMLACYWGCPECGQSLVEFTHHRCGAEDV